MAIPVPVYSALNFQRKTMHVRVEQPPNKVYGCLQKVPIDTLCLPIIIDCII